MADYSKNYTVIALEDLERERQLAHQSCRLLEKLNGGEYKLRTFWLGPRDKPTHQFSSRPASTPRRNAIAAKIGIYKVQGYYQDRAWSIRVSGKSRRRPYMSLQGYI